VEHASRDARFGLVRTWAGGLIPTTHKVVRYSGSRS
jgi:hypothetical protein